MWPSLFRTSTSLYSRSNSRLFSSLRPQRTATSAVEVLDYRDIEVPEDIRRCELHSKLLLTCEHASNHLPLPYRWSVKDQALRDTHWAYDPGAAQITRELAPRLGCMAVLSSFSRLLVDPNRPLASQTLFRDSADGVTIDLNEQMPIEDRDARIARFYIPYHLELGRAARDVDPLLVLAIHSFNPTYEGDVRDFELGVLSTSEDNLVSELCDHFKAAGLKTRINQPWSGKEGFMYAADSVRVSGEPGRRHSLMLEFRNDLLQNAQWRNKVTEVLLSSLKQLTLLAPTTN